MKELIDVTFKVLVGLLIVSAFVYLWVIPTVTGLLRILG